MPTDQQSQVLLATDQGASVLMRLMGQGMTPFNYTPFGHSSSDEPGSRSSFNGQMREGLLPIYLLGQGYRAFNTAQQRFHSPDSLSPFDEGGLNAYAYCLGDPVNQTDPSGHSLLSKFLSLFGKSAKKTGRKSGNITTKSVNKINSPTLQRSSEDVFRTVSQNVESPMTPRSSSILSTSSSEAAMVVKKIKAAPVKAPKKVKGIIEMSGQNPDGSPFLWRPESPRAPILTQSRINTNFPPGFSGPTRVSTSTVRVGLNVPQGAPTSTGSGISAIRKTNSNVPYR
jgi:RHS repeat-associated protein